MTLFALPHIQEFLPEAPGLPLLSSMPRNTELTPDVQCRIERYLAEAPCVVATGRQEDPAKPVLGQVVDFSVLTDGEWVWPAYWAYLVAEYKVMLPRAFIDHISARDFTPPRLSVAELVAVDEQRADAVVVDVDDDVTSPPNETR